MFCGSSDSLIFTYVSSFDPTGSCQVGGQSVKITKIKVSTNYVSASMV